MSKWTKVRHTCGAPRAREDGISVTIKTAKGTQFCIGPEIWVDTCRTQSNIPIEPSQIGLNKALWNLLARSLSPYPQKLRALKTKSWPLALHGIAAAMLADNHFSTLRTGAVRGLREHSSGMSPMLHLSAVEHPMHDPQFFDVHSHDLQNTRSSSRCDGLHHSGPPSPLCRPCHVLLTRLHQLGWAWQTRGQFVDHEGLQIDVLGCPIQELKQRLVEGWQKAEFLALSSTGRRLQVHLSCTLP